jgi:hypothetical protein
MVGSAPGYHGVMGAGMQGTKPGMADIPRVAANMAALASRTCGLAGLLHPWNGWMFTIGTVSVIFAGVGRPESAC